MVSILGHGDLLLIGGVIAFGSVGELISAPNKGFLGKLLVFGVFIVSLGSISEYLVLPDGATQSTMQLCFWAYPTALIVSFFAVVKGAMA
ncbi:hypothetical protein [Nocardia sp. NPDC059236]